MKRDDMLKRARESAQPWDMIIVGGGATGAGVAVDAATRGYTTLLLEQHDFGKGTSSRSTKLVHGGVRYLEQGNVSLVMEALKERGILRQNAPHLVSELACVVPSYAWWEGPFYGIGLKVYEMLAGKYGFGKSQAISKEETLKRLPNINPDGLTGGVVYYDGQFDDTRLLINLITTAAEQGATLLNYAKVTRLHKGSDGVVNGVRWENMETGETFSAHAKVVVNATGTFTDSVRRLAEPDASQLIAPSQGPIWCSIVRFCREQMPSLCHTPKTDESCSPSPGMATLWLARPIPRLSKPRWNPSPLTMKSNSCWKPPNFIWRRSLPDPTS